mgnify:CR=1 FL=1
MIFADGTFGLAITRSRGCRRGARRETAAKRTRLADIANQQLGSVVPADMTGNVCKQKPAVTLVGGKALTGWGISLGQYDTPAVEEVLTKKSGGGVPFPLTPVNPDKARSAMVNP